MSGPGNEFIDKWLLALCISSQKNVHPGLFDFNITANAYLSMMLRNGTEIALDNVSVTSWKRQCSKNLALGKL